MNEISVVMVAYNAEIFISEAIESVLKQSFSDFEFIIVDDGSTDNTKKIIRSYTDSRIRVVENRHNYIESLNLGIDNARRKYIARMDADDIMHIDRLKIQYSIMEEEPGITVCSSWMSPFGENISRGSVSQSVSGFVENPLLLFLKGNFIFHPTTMIRSNFLRKHLLQYENYEYAEDYKLWVDTTKKGGNFYIEPQPLLFYRVSKQQISNVKKDLQNNTSGRIKKEILDYLMLLNSEKFASIKKVADAMWSAKNEKIMDDNDIFSFFYSMFMKNRNFLITGHNMHLL